MMQLIYVYVGNLLSGITIFLFYQRAQTEKLKVVSMILIPIVFSTYMSTVRGYIGEPFRIVIAVLLIIFLLKLLKEKISYISLIAAFVLVYSLWLFIFFMMIIIILISNIENELLISISSLLFEILVYLGVYKKIEFSESTLSLLNEAGISGVFYTVSLLSIILYSAFHFLAGSEIEDTYASLVISGLIISVLFIIIFLSIYLIRYLTKRKKEQVGLEKEQLRLESEKVTLKEDLDKITSLHHKYRHVVPTLLTSHQGLTNELEHIIGADQATQVQRVKNHINLLKRLSSEISEEFLVDNIKMKVDYLNFPAEWFDLTALVERFIRIAAEKGIYLSIHNHATAWSDLDVTKVSFLRLFGNLIDNAIKELAKIAEGDHHQIIVLFQEVDGYFSFEITDTAPEFEMDILVNLGKRKNSTNGTGDGYAEVVEILERSNASLVITEWKDDTGPGKKISVVFDGLGLFVIDSNYRHDELKKALVESKLQVLDME